MKINENKTLKEFREKGFYVIGYSLVYDVNSLCRMVFDINCYSDDYLCYTGEEYSTLVNPKRYKKEIKMILKELKESGFII